MSEPDLYRNLADHIVAFMTARAGEFIDARTLAREYGVTVATIRQKLGKLAESGRIRVGRDGRMNRYYVPSAAQLAVMQAALPLRSHGQYKPPAHLMERLQELQAHREAFPSHYGQGTPGQWKARQG